MEKVKWYSGLENSGDDAIDAQPPVTPGQSAPYQVFATDLQLASGTENKQDMERYFYLVQ